MSQEDSFLFKVHTAGYTAWFSEEDSEDNLNVLKEGMRVSELFILNQWNAVTALSQRSANLGALFSAIASAVLIFSNQIREQYSSCTTHSLYILASGFFIASIGMWMGALSTKWRQSGFLPSQLVGNSNKKDLILWYGGALLQYDGFIKENTKTIRRIKRLVNISGIVALSSILIATIAYFSLNYYYCPALKGAGVVV